MSSPPTVPPHALPYAGPGATPPRRSKRAWIIVPVVLVFAGLIWIGLRSAAPAAQTIALSDFSTLLEQGDVRTVIVDGDELTGHLAASRVIGGQSVVGFRTYVPSGAGGSWAFTEWLLAHRNGARVVAEPNNNLLVNVILPFIPWLLILAFIWYFVFRRLRPQTGPREPVPVFLVNPEPRA